MSSVSAFDFAAILAPLPGGQPAGPSLRYDPVYDAIREARRQDDATLPVGIWQSAAKRADWEEAIRLCRSVLETRSKDLQVACWLAEALVHRHGFAGLGPALHMLGGLCGAFWDGLYPEIDDGDLAGRVAPLEWLNGKLPPLLHTLPVTRSGSAGQTVVTHSYADYENAQRRHLAGVRDPRTLQAAVAKGEALLPDIDAGTLATPVTFHRTLRTQLADAIDAIDALSALLDKLCGRQSPGLVGLRSACGSLQGWVDTALRAKGEEPVMPTEAPTDTSFDPEGFEDGEDRFAGDVEEEVSPGYDTGPIQTREEAYYWLAASADFLMRTEPHSPTPYLIQRALSWANMPLHEVLLEVSRGRNDLAAVFDFLGFNFAEMSQKNGEKKEK